MGVYFAERVTQEWAGDTERQSYMIHRASQNKMEFLLNSYKFSSQ